MNPPKINTTGNAQIDSLTAELAVILRDAGYTEREAVEEAQRLRNQWILAVISPVTRLVQDPVE